MDHSIERSSGVPGRTLWLVRHGESTWNALGLVQGQKTGPRLTSRGASQAHALSRFLGGRVVCSVYCSDLVRAVETARPVAEVHGLTPVLDERLRERSFGSAEGTPSSSLGPECSGLDAGRVVDADAAPPGGESVRQLRRRVGGFFNELAATDDRCHGRPGDVVLVVHGGVVRAALAHLEDVPAEEMSWGPVRNGQAMAVPFVPDRRHRDRGRRPSLGMLRGDGATGTVAWRAGDGADRLRRRGAR